jgi:hypothetical protein
MLALPGVTGILIFSFVSCPGHAATHARINGASDFSVSD